MWPYLCLGCFSSLRAPLGARERTEDTEERTMNKSEGQKGVKTVGAGHGARASCWPSC